MELLSEIPDGVLAAIVAAAIGGLVGAFIVGIRADLTMSALVGLITGLSVATVMKMLEVEPIFGVEGFSMVYAALAGAGTSWIVGKTS